MAIISIGTIEVYVLSLPADACRVLALQRSHATRCAGTWETVHGRIELGEEPQDAAVREVLEETGLAVQRLYSLNVNPFYLHRARAVELSVGFTAFVDPRAPVTLGEEHTRYEWLSFESALERFFWPRERTALREAIQLFRSGDGGAAEDVLRVF